MTANRTIKTLCKRVKRLFAATQKPPNIARYSDPSPVRRKSGAALSSRAPAIMASAGDAPDLVGVECDVHSVAVDAGRRAAYRMSDTAVQKGSPPSEVGAYRVPQDQAQLAGTEDAVNSATDFCANETPLEGYATAERDVTEQYSSPPTFFFTPRLSPRGRPSPVTRRCMDSPLGSEASPNFGTVEAGVDPPVPCQESSAPIQPPCEFEPQPSRNKEQDWMVSSLYSSAAAVDRNDKPTKSALKICQLSNHLPLSMARSTWYLQDFLILSNAETRNKLKVYHAICVHSQLQVDLKAYHKDRMSSSELKMLQQRAVVLSELWHPHVVRFYGAFEDVHNIYFLHERSVPAQISEMGALQETECISVWLLPLLTAFDYLVSRSIRLGLPCLHNLVFTADHTVKYSEFIAAWDERTPSMCEMDWWAALAPPERCGRLPPGVPKTQNFEERTLSWSMGTLAFRLLTGSLPSKPALNSCDEALAGDALYDGLPQSLSETLSADAIGFLGAALNLNPRERTKIKDLLMHDFVTMGRGLPDTGLTEPRRLSEDSYMSSFAVPRGPSVDSFAVPRGPSVDSFAVPRGPSVDSFAVPRGPSVDTLACDPSRLSRAEYYRGSQDVSGFESERCSLSDPKSSQDDRSGISRRSRLSQGICPPGAFVREGVPVAVIRDSQCQLTPSSGRTREEGCTTQPRSNSLPIETGGMFLPSKGVSGFQPSRDSGRDDIRRRISDAIQSHSRPQIPSAVDRMVQHAVMLEQ